MAGTWLSVLKGFGGMRVKDGKLYFNPFLPEQWKSYSFRLEFRGRVIKVKVAKDGVETELESGEPMEICLKDELVEVS
jgi:maltose phosphorylase